jgi:flavin reductase (DIM6/NTAB) family NADH-FMN oxidoreductase RutF
MTESVSAAPVPSHGSDRWSLSTSADPDTVRAALRRAISGVTVVTTEHEGRPWGLTVSAFTPVCIEPPTVLVCVSSRTVTGAAIGAGGRFAVNLLSQDQLYVAQRCARAGRPKYLDDDVVTPTELPARVAAPVLRDSLVTFDCEVTEARPVGSHLVLFGAVRTVLAPAARQPLLFGDGRYHHCVEFDEMPALVGALAWV